MKHTTAVLILLSVAFTDALCMEDQERALLNGSSSNKMQLSPRSGYGSINDDVEGQQRDKDDNGCCNECNKKILTFCCSLSGIIAFLTLAQFAEPIEQSNSNQTLSFSGSHSHSN